MKKFIIPIVALLLLLTSELAYAGPFEIFIETDLDGDYTYKKHSGTIKTAGQPINANVVLRNASGSKRYLWDPDKKGRFWKISIAVTDEDGQTIVIEKSKGSLSGKNEFMPNDTRRYYIPLQSAMWPGASFVGEDRVKRFKIKVIYENNTRKISSRSYNVEIRP